MRLFNMRPLPGREPFTHRCRKAHDLAHNGVVCGKVVDFQLQTFRPKAERLTPSQFLREVDELLRDDLKDQSADDVLRELRRS